MKEYKNGNFYIGEVNDQLLEHGMGKIIVPRKNTNLYPDFDYNGEWKNGKIDGHGKVTQLDNREITGQYEGEYSKDCKDGYGIFTDVKKKTLSIMEISEYFG